MDSALLRNHPRALAETLAEAGVKLVQYRGKRASSRDLFHTCKQLSDFLNSSGVRLVVNDRADIAALVSAAGVHVGQEDLSVEEARAICGASCWVGVSTHTLEQVREANATSADYLAVGPIFSTTTKKRPDPVVGMDFVRRARALTEKPLVAIGGITLERAAEVFEAGADSVAVASDVICAADVAARARQYLELAARIVAHPN